jgi:hypothetical protein
LSSDSGRTQQIGTVTEGTALGARTTTARAIATERRHLPDVQRAQRALVVRAVDELRTVVVDIAPRGTEPRGR